MNNAKTQFNVDQFSTVFTLVMLASFSAMVLLTAPALVRAFITDLNFTPQQAGYIISIDMAGMAIATIPALFWLNKINWRTVAFISLLLNAVFHLMSAFVQSYETLLIVRFFAGFFAGSTMSVCLASLGLTLHKERNFGYWVMGQLILGSLGLALIPQIINQWGLSSIYLFCAVSVAILLMFVNFLPKSGVVNEELDKQVIKLDKHQLVLGGIGVIAIYSFYVALSGVWTYIGSIGSSSNISVDSIGYYLSVASLAGIVGAISASYFGESWGRSKPVIIGFILIIISLLLLFGTIQPMQYLLATGIFKYSWTFILPFMMAALSSLDSSGRLIVTTNIFIGGGLATGPLLAAKLINSGDYTPIIWFGIMSMVFSFICILPLLLSKQGKVVPNLPLNNCEIN
jgi:predicted MFS family arabinose efflux permease